jgi:Synergist-CTERM protein sorting domain-containing protein
MGGASGANSYLSPDADSLTDRGSGKWQITMSKANLTGSQGVNNSSNPGKYDFVIGGRTTDNESFTGVALLIFSDGILTHNVKFVDWDGTVIEEMPVEFGKAASAPEDPEREGHVFTGWDKDFTNITGDLTVTAEYERKRGGGSGCNAGFFAFAVIGIAAFVFRRK